MTKFYGYFRSSSAYRCRIAFNLKQIDYEFISVHLKKDGGQQKLPAFLQRNPQGLVPALEHDGLELTQSLAIIEWLDETFPQFPLMPDDKDTRAQVRAFAQVIACEVHPLQNLRVLQYLKNELDQPQEQLDRWCQRWIEDGLSACEGLLAKQNHSGKYCFGDTPGLADICLVPQVFSAQRFGADISTLKRVNAIYDACQALPAFADAHPAKQPDAEP